MLEVDSNESPDTLKLNKDTKERADNHKEWLEKHAEPEAKLPVLKKYMYSNGLPVANWETDYVDNVLKQFGY